MSKVPKPAQGKSWREGERLACPVCGKPLRPQGSEVLVSHEKRKRRPRLYCSPTCKRRAAYERISFTTPIRLGDCHEIGGKKLGKSMYCIVAGPHLGPTSLRLASLPLDPVTAARVEAGNRLPAVLPQNLVPSTAAYLAGLAKVRDAQPDAPSIAPAASNDGAGLDIPAFLRRDQP